MPEKIKPELLRLLEPSALPCRILVVESLAYLPRLREMFPRAELLACADDPELPWRGRRGRAGPAWGKSRSRAAWRNFLRG